MSMIKLKRIAAAISFVALVTISIPSIVLASDTEINKDSSGNTFIAGSSVSVSETIGNELFAVGQDVNANGTDVSGSAFMAGMNVSFKDSSVGSSVFTAGMNVTIGTQAVNNIWVVGQNVSLQENTTAKAVHAAGESVSVKGQYDFASVYGNSIVFDGTVNGDAEFEGNVTFGDNAKIDGKVTVRGTQEPVVEDGATVGNIEFELIEQGDKDKEDTVEKAVDVASNAAKKTIGFIIISKIKKFIYWALAFTVFAIVFATMFKKNLTDSYEMAVKTRPLAFWLSGVIGLVAVPFAVLILCITFVGAPAGLFILGIYFLSFVVARVFACASLLRELIFSHTQKRLNPIIETILAVLIGALTKVIPVVSGIVGLICKTYMLGYVIQTVYSKMHTTKEVESADTLGE